MFSDMKYLLCTFIPIFCIISNLLLVSKIVFLSAYVNL